MNNDKNISLCLFVHDFHSQIGHSRAIAEKIKGLRPEEVDNIFLYSYTTTEPEKLLGNELGAKVRWVKIPLGFLRPYFIRNLFYQIFCYLHLVITGRMESIKIGIGTAFAPVDFVDMQFYQLPWSKMYFDILKPTFIKGIYRSFYFKLQNWIEKRIILNPKTNVVCLSKFIQESITSDYSVGSERVSLIYSGINLDEFSMPDRPKDDVVLELVKEYPQLQKIDFTKPVFLFVGAFERKGLPKIVEDLKNVKDVQFVVIGSPEANSKINLNDYDFICHVPFTRRVSDFYAVCDTFIFHSYFEPFGLVVLEAFAMGCNIVSSSNSVGSMELIIGQTNVYDYSDENIVKCNSLLSAEKRSDLVKKRKKILTELNWEKRRAEFRELIIKNCS